MPHAVVLSEGMPGFVWGLSVGTLQSDPIDPPTPRKDFGISPCRRSPVAAEGLVLERRVDRAAKRLTFRPIQTSAHGLPLKRKKGREKRRYIFEVCTATSSVNQLDEASDSVGGEPRIIQKEN